MSGVGSDAIIDVYRKDFVAQGARLPPGMERVITTPKPIGAGLTHKNAILPGCILESSSPTPPSGGCCVRADLELVLRVLALHIACLVCDAGNGAASDHSGH